MKLTKFSTNRSIEDGIKMSKQRVSDALYIYEKYKDEFIYRECPCCGGEKYIDFDKFHDTYNMVNCDRCKTVFINPCPNMDALDEYYSQSKTSKFNREMWAKRKKRTKAEYLFDDRIVQLKNIINKIKKGNGEPIRILEVGAGSGNFLEIVSETLVEYNLELVGIDIDKGASEEAQGRNINVQYANIEDIIHSHNDQYDIIMHFELIEHLIYPRVFLENCLKIIKNGGYILFSTPNGEGFDNKEISYNFEDRMIAHSIFPPMHLNSYNISNINFLLLDIGFNIDEITTPGKLDVDIVNEHTKLHKKDSNELTDSLLRIDDQSLALIQSILVRTKASSHMLIVGKK